MLLLALVIKATFDVFHNTQRSKSAFGPSTLHTLTVIFGFSGFFVCLFCRS